MSPSSVVKPLSPLKADIKDVLGVCVRMSKFAVGICLVPIRKLREVKAGDKKIYTEEFSFLARTKRGGQNLFDSHRLQRFYFDFHYGDVIEKLLRFLWYGRRRCLVFMFHLKIGIYWQEFYQVLLIKLDNEAEGIAGEDKTHAVLLSGAGHAFLIPGNIDELQKKRRRAIKAKKNGKKNNCR